MIFITNSDLKAHTFEVFIVELSNNYDASILDPIEDENIAIVKSKLNGRFDTTSIFSQTAGDRNPLIIKALAAMITYDLIDRNAPRKMSENIKERYKWAMAWLKDVRNGVEQPDGLPLLQDTNGNDVTPVITGNNRNDNHYL
jgi:phage gp36-like protein